LVVTDAGGDYALRGVLAIDPDKTFLWPDAIANPNYRVWDENSMTPLFWSLDGQGSIEPIFLKGIDGIRLTLASESHTARRMALATTVLLPETPFGIWVYPPANDPQITYGLEIIGDDHRVWMLFGPQGYNGPADQGVFVINHTAPSATWSYEPIDIPAAFAAAGWPVPSMRPSLVGGAFMDSRQIELRLLFMSEDPVTRTAVFGPIEQSEYRVPPQALMAEAFDDPAGYYVRLAEAYLGQRNMPLALEAYQRALEFAPADPNIAASIALLKQRINGDKP
jgi:hypothetical protein